MGAGTRMYWQAICLMGLVIALLGCEMQMGTRPPEYQPVQPRPTLKTRPSALEFQRGVCTDRCREIIAAAKLSSFRKRREALEDIAVLPNLTTHEQIHLIDVAEAKLNSFDRYDVFIKLAENRTLTVDARRYLKLKVDDVGPPKNQRKLRRELEKNPGIQPGQGKPPTPETKVYVLTGIEWLICNYYEYKPETVVRLYSLGCTSEDMIVILHLAFYTTVNPVEVAKWRVEEHLSWTDISWKLKLNPLIYYTPISKEKIPHGPPYGRAYGLYHRFWREPRRIILTDEEVINLVQLRTTSEAYQTTPEDVIKLQQEGKSIEEVIERKAREKESIRTKKGRKVKVPLKEREEKGKPKGKGKAKGKGKSKGKDK